MDGKLIKRLNAAVTTGMEGAGTLPAKDSVKVRPKDWHAICDLAKALYAASLESQCDCEALEARVAALEAAFKHYHVVGRDGDACAKCGLDLRDEIHFRLAGGSDDRS